MSSMSTCRHGRKENQLSEPFRNSRISDDSLQAGNEEKEEDKEEVVVVQIIQIAAGCSRRVGWWSSETLWTAADG